MSNGHKLIATIGWLKIDVESYDDYSSFVGKVYL